MKGGFHFYRPGKPERAFGQGMEMLLVSFGGGVSPVAASDLSTNWPVALVVDGGCRVTVVELRG